MSLGYWDESYPPSVYGPPPVVVPATGATAGIPGTFTPPGSAAPANFAGMVGLTPTPSTPWTTGQFVQTKTSGSAGRACWSGTDWVSGIAP